PPKGNGPGYSEAAPTTDGFVVPPASQAAPIAGSTTSLEHDQKNWGDLQKEWMNARPSVEKGLQRIQDMTDALRQVYTGQYVTDFAEWRAKIKGLTGVDFKTLPDPAQVERLLKDNFSTSVETMKSTGLSRWTQAELFSSQKNFANPDLQPEANLRILSQTAGTLDWERHMMDAFPRGKGYGWRDPIDFQTKFVAQPQNSLQGSVDRWYAKLGEGMQ